MIKLGAQGRDKRHDWNRPIATPRICNRCMVIHQVERVAGRRWESIFTWPTGFVFVERYGLAMPSCGQAPPRGIQEFK